MSENQLKALLEAIKTDTLLKKRLKDASDLEAVVAIASEAGFDVTTSELQMAQSEMSVELSDEELERVAGGQACGDSTVWG